MYRCNHTVQTISTGTNKMSEDEDDEQTLSSDHALGGLLIDDLTRCLSDHLDRPLLGDRAIFSLEVVLPPPLAVGFVLPHS